MTMSEAREYEIGRSYGEAYANVYGVADAVSAVKHLERLGNQQHKVAGMCDRLLERVQEKG